ncbi:MAG: flagellar hook-basal body complex protein [Acidobacteriota bacterium]|nr:flagellar hook-basal body complex protein [Acidobacteriota bacterium]
MDPLTAAAANGLQASMDSFDMLANNLANSSTSGFKADREFYTTYLAPEADDQFNPSVGESPLVQKQWTDFSQGTLLSTDNTTDFALSGTGFFAVNGPKGPLYTRSGNFHFSPQGTLVSAEGYPVRLTGGQTLQAQSASPAAGGRRRADRAGRNTARAVRTGDLQGRVATFAWRGKLLPELRLTG